MTMISISLCSKNVHLRFINHLFLKLAWSIPTLSVIYLYTGSYLCFIFLGMFAAAYVFASATFLPIFGETADWIGVYVCFVHKSICHRKFISKKYNKFESSLLFQSSIWMAIDCNLHSLSWIMIVFFIHLLICSDSPHNIIKIVCEREKTVFIWFESNGEMRIE